MPNGLLIQEKRYGAAHMDTASIEARLAKKRAETGVGGVLFLGSAVLWLASFACFFWEFPSGLWHWTVLFQPSLTFFLASIAGLFSCLTFLHQIEVVRHVLSIPRRGHGEMAPDISVFDTADDMIDIVHFFHPTAMKGMETAFGLAERFGHAHVEPLHVFIAMMDDPSASLLFGRLGIVFEEIKDPLSRRLSTRLLGEFLGPDEMTERVCLSAFRQAYLQQSSGVSALDLFAEAFAADAFLQELFEEHEVRAEQFGNMVEWIRIHERIREQYLRFQRAAAQKPTGPMNRAMTSVATPVLDAFSDDLTTMAVNGQLPIMIGREDEMEQLFRIVEGGRSSVVLVGSPGVGKESILAGLAARMVEEEVPDVLKDKRLVQVSLPHLVGGVSEQEAQERFLHLLNEVARSRNIILTFTDLDQLPATLVPLLSEYVTRGATFLIGTTTPQAYSAAIERSLLGRLFERITVQEPDERLAIRMLESKIGMIEHEKAVLFQYAAVEACVQLTDRYMHETYLPEKAIMVAREVAQAVVSSKGASAVVTAEDVAKVVAQKTGIPMSNVAEDEKQKLLHLEEVMHGRVIGQDEAVRAVASALRRARADIRSTQRPIASFLFLGPTGVGKTELAKTLAATYFGAEEMMVRVDMSEYQDVRAIDKLLGVPGGSQGGLFSEAVRARPFSVILLDELEKADPGVLNVFLQILDDGRVTDAVGRVIDFTNTIIIATSNAGSTYIQEAVLQGESMERMKVRLMEEELRGVYRPEFLNRFDGVIVFRPLQKEQVAQIAALMVRAVAKRLEQKGIGFEVTPEALQEISEKGFDPKFGARPLRRVVQEEVDNAVATALLDGSVRRRDTIVLQKGGTLQIRKGQAL